MDDEGKNEPNDCGPVKVMYSREELLDSAFAFWDGNIRESELSSTEKLSSYGMLMLFVEGLFQRSYDQQPRGGREG